MANDRLAVGAQQLAEDAIAAAGGRPPISGSATSQALRSPWWKGLTIDPIRSGVGWLTDAYYGATPLRYQSGPSVGSVGGMAPSPDPLMADEWSRYSSPEGKQTWQRGRALRLAQTELPGTRAQDIFKQQLKIDKPIWSATRNPLARFLVGGGGKLITSLTNPIGLAANAALYSGGLSPDLPVTAMQGDTQPGEDIALSQALQSAIKARKDEQIEPRPSWEDLSEQWTKRREELYAPDFEEQLGYDKADELRWHAERARGVGNPTVDEMSASRQALGGLIEKIDFGSEEDITKLVGQTWSGIGGDEISELVYNMPVGVPSEGVSDVTPVVTEDDLRALQANQQVYYADTVEPPTDKQIADSKLNIDRLIKEAAKDKPMVSRVSQALTDYAWGKDVGELEAIAALTEADPTFNFEKYLDLTSQEVMDITSQVESFAGIPTVQPGAEAPWIPPAPFQDHLGFPSVIPDIVVPPPAEAQAPYVEDFSAIQQADKARQARDRASERVREAEAASAKKERAADRAAAKRVRAADKATVKKAATVSRKAEAKREAATKTKAAKQRSALDAASKKALQEHQAWMATQSVRLEKEKKRRQKQGYGVGAMYT